MERQKRDRMGIMVAWCLAKSWRGLRSLSYLQRPQDIRIYGSPTAGELLQRLSWAWQTHLEVLWLNLLTHRGRVMEDRKIFPTWCYTSLSLFVSQRRLPLQNWPASGLRRGHTFFLHTSTSTNALFSFRRCPQGTTPAIHQISFRLSRILHDNDTLHRLCRTL